MKSLSHLEADDELRRSNLVKSLNASEKDLVLRLDGLREPLHALLSSASGTTRRKAVRAHIAKCNPYASARMRVIALAHWKDKQYYFAVTRWLQAEWDFAMSCDVASAALSLGTASGASLERVHMPISEEAAVRQRLGQTVIGPQLSRLKALRVTLDRGEIGQAVFDRERVEVERIVAEARGSGQKACATAKGRPPTVAAYLSEALLTPLILAGFGDVGAPTIADAIDFVQAAAEFFYVGARKRHIAGQAPREIKLTENGLRATATALRKRLV